MTALVVKSAVKKFNSALGKRTSAEALDYLSKVVEEICRCSCVSAVDDRVGTVKARHIQASISVLTAPRLEK